MYLLEQAEKIAGEGGRSEGYGHPFDNFSKTGKMWAAILGIDEITPEQVALMMVAPKNTVERWEENLILSRELFNEAGVEILEV